MNYDCHLEVSSLTPRKDVSDYLSRSKPSGVVYVQKGTDYRSRSEWMTHMSGTSGACGVAMVSPYDSNDGFARLASLGVCGARLTVSGASSAAQVQQQIYSLHEALPRPWHIELEATVGTASLLAPLLARTDRVFCLLPILARGAVSHATLRKVLWWLDMGNAYVKFTSPLVEEHPGSIFELICRSTPDRVVLGTGEPTHHLNAPWLEDEFISPEQADDNARRLYPFFRANQMH